MQNELITVALQLAVVAAAGFVAALAAPKRFRLLWFIAALALYVVYDALLTRGFWTLPNPFPDANWNWSGKILAIVGLLVLALLMGRYKVGLTLRQAEGSRVAWIVFAVFTALFFGLAIHFADGRDDWETIAFQWTMPGLDEELFYRGVLVAALNEAFVAKSRILGASIGVGGLLTSLLFGLVHALGFSEAGVSFDWATLAMTGGPSLLVLWMREKTGSLLLPVLAHNVANGAFTLF